MDIIEALHNRRSIRQFKNTPIPEEVLNRVIENALQSPSNSNSQPYRIAVATGDTCNEIRDELTKKYQKASVIQTKPLPIKATQAVLQGVVPDGDFNPVIKYPPELQQRKFVCGMGLYETLGIDRKDKAARERQMLRNFEFFDAPAAIFMFINSKLDRYAALDGGIFMQSLMLSALNEGLGTCAQGALAIWGGPVRERFKVDKGYKLICGLSIGYPEEHSVNQYAPEKRSVDSVCLKTK